MMQPIRVYAWKPTALWIPLLLVLVSVGAFGYMYQRCVDLSNRIDSVSARIAATELANQRFFETEYISQDGSWHLRKDLNHAK
jgi:hypothetical protein